MLYTKAFMVFFQKSLVKFVVIIVVLGNLPSSESNGQEVNTLNEVDNSCSTDDLNHSILVQSCYGAETCFPKKFSSKEEVFHLYSSRTGDRLKFETSTNLNYAESEEEKLLNINTTIYVNTKKKSTRSLVGIGTTLDSKKLISSIRNGSFRTLIAPLINDLIQINALLVRLKFDRLDLVNHDSKRVILALDSFVAEEGKQLDLILDLEKLDYSSETFDALENLALLFKTTHSIRCYSAQLSPNIYNNTDYIRHLFGGNYHFETDLENLPLQVIHNTNEKNHFNTVLLKLNYSISYSILEYVKDRWKEGDLIAIGRRKPVIRKFGDWQNAQNFAVEILNSLKFGSNGFMENLPVVDVLKQSNSSDTLIYNLRPNLDRHYMSPIFYAMAHFSLHLPAGSRVLDSYVLTQPNMFAANYIAFETPENHTVVIALNDNEHNLPFRIAIDEKIISAYSLKPKSFNSFVIKH